MKSRSFILAVALTVVWAALAGASGPVHTDFENGIPPGWTPAGLGPQKDNGHAQTLRGPGGNHFLRISTDGTFYSIGITSPFDPQKFPVVSWRWRVARLPAAADISKKTGDDAAARLFVTFANHDSSHGRHRRALIYVWDAKYPVGTIIASPYFPRTQKAIVLESGPAQVGQWVAERVNLVSDYRRAFGGNPPEVERIACASDSDQTHTPTTADFDDLQVRAQAETNRR
jgi:hypothetical protein